MTLGQTQSLSFISTALKPPQIRRKTILGMHGSWVNIGIGLDNHGLGHGVMSPSLTKPIPSYVGVDIHCGQSLLYTLLCQRHQGHSL